MSTTVGIGAKKKGSKNADAVLVKENKELRKKVKALEEENKLLRSKASGTENNSEEAGNKAE